jgi:hypothetical protein
MRATTPRIEKIPAPIMPPTPILIAATSPISERFVESVIREIASEGLMRAVDDLA